MSAFSVVPPSVSTEIRTASPRKLRSRTVPATPPAASVSPIRSKRSATATLWPA
jgi:hypothetical protein